MIRLVINDVGVHFLKMMMNLLVFKGQSNGSQAD